MDAQVAFFAILGALTIGAMSPGPSFVVVARTAVAASRRDGLAAGLGMGVGGVTFGALALLGLQTVLARVAWLDAGLKVAGGLYLLYLAVRLWGDAGAPVTLPEGRGAGPAGPARSFALGLSTQLSNPKTVVAYASIFAALLPAVHPRWLYVALPPSIFVIEAGWYSLVALTFSAGRPRAVYLRLKSWIDGAAGGVMAALGLRLLVDAGRAA